MNTGQGRNYWKVERPNGERYSVHPRHAVTVGGEVISSGGGGRWIVATNKIPARAVKGDRRRHIKP